MINFFRKIRKQLADDNKPIKYFRYAVGEIVLVMIGILLALQVNNWNEGKKLERNQTLILNGLVQSINNDLNIYENVYEERLERKRRAIDTLIYFIGNDIKISDSIFMSYFGDVDFDIGVRYDSGPYDALKSTGLNQIKNDSLREKIVRAYDFSLPLYMEFSNVPVKEFSPLIMELESHIIESRVVRNRRGESEIYDYPSINNALKSPILVKILKLENIKYNNFKRRLESMKRIQRDLKSKILSELENS